MHNLNERSSEKKQREKIGDKPWWQPGLVLFARLSGWIIGPVIVAVFVGKWLDGKYHTAPWLFLSTVGLAFILSMIGIVKESYKAMGEMGGQGDKMDKKDK